MNAIRGVYLESFLARMSDFVIRIINVFVNTGRTEPGFGTVVDTEVPIKGFLDVPLEAKVDRLVFFVVCSRAGNGFEEVKGYNTVGFGIGDRGGFGCRDEGLVVGFGVFPCKREAAL